MTHTPRPQLPSDPDRLREVDEQVALALGCCEFALSELRSYAATPRPSPPVILHGPPYGFMTVGINHLAHVVDAVVRASGACRPILDLLGLPASDLDRLRVLGDPNAPRRAGQLPAIEVVDETEERPTISLEEVQQPFGKLLRVADPDPAIAEDNLVVVRRLVEFFTSVQEAVATLKKRVWWATRPPTYSERVRVVIAGTCTVAIDGGPAVEETELQAKVLRYLAEAGGRPMTSTQMAEREAEETGLPPAKRRGDNLDEFKASRAKKQLMESKPALGRLIKLTENTKGFFLELPPLRL